MTEKQFLKIIDDYYIKYGDEGELFSMHKPSDIRSLIVANDWTKLKEMVEEDKKNEELLHMEFKCYEGDNDD